VIALGIVAALCIGVILLVAYKRRASEQEGSGEER